MNPMTKKLRILLYVIASYLATFGILFLLVPDVAQELTKTKHDPILSLLYGQYTLTFALIAVMAARENRTSKLSLVVLLLTIGHVIIFGYLLISEMQAFAQAGPPLIVNLILAILLFLFRKDDVSLRIVG